MTPLDRDILTLGLVRRPFVLDFRPRRPATGEVDRDLLELAVRGYRPQETPAKRILPFLLLLAFGCSSSDLNTVTACAAAVAECAGTFRELPASRAFVPSTKSTPVLAIVLEPACSWALLAPSASSTPKITPPATVWLLDGGVCRVDPGP